MKYVLLFCGDDQDARDFASLSPEQLRERYMEVLGWMMQHKDQILYSERLQDPTTSTTVRHDFWGKSEPVITDGPFMESKEQIGGYACIDVPDLDEALRLARTWPGRGKVEVRPAMVMG
jgi:hypothetical protein